MSPRRIVLAAAALLAATCPASSFADAPNRPAVAREQVVERVTLEMFEEELSPYGTWVVVPTLGRVWRPAARVVGPGFVPYATRGHWVYTDDGWIFESDHPWGWATFHYGRWARDITYGWVWVPGFVWAPAWVEWRSGGGYIGWVPLSPPSFRVIASHWIFVEERHFLEPHVVAFAVRPVDAATVYARTTVSRTYVVREGVRWSVGPSTTVISRATRTVIRTEPRRPAIPARVRVRHGGHA